jgi:hypothetical protein
MLDCKAAVGRVCGVASSSWTEVESMKRQSLELEDGFKPSLRMLQVEKWQWKRAMLIAQATFPSSPTRRIHTQHAAPTILTCT